MTKYQIFTILPQISHFHKYRNFSSIFATFLYQLLHPYKFYGRDMSGILFFIFASCHPLNLLLHYRCKSGQTNNQMHQTSAKLLFTTTLEKGGSILLALFQLLLRAKYLHRIKHPTFTYFLVLRRAIQKCHLKASMKIMNK